MALPETLIFGIAVVFAWIRVMVGPTLQLRNFFIGFLVGLSLTLVNRFIYEKMIDVFVFVEERFVREDAKTDSWGGFGSFAFPSFFSLLGALVCLYYYRWGWSGMLVGYVLLFPLISGPLLLITHWGYQEGIRKERERNEANNSSDQAETELSKREDSETDGD